MKKALMTLRFYLILVETFNLSMMKAALLHWIPNHPDGSDPRDRNSFGEKERRNLMRSGKVGGSGPAHTGLAPGAPPPLVRPCPTLTHCVLPTYWKTVTGRVTLRGMHFLLSTSNLPFSYPHPCPEHCWCACRGVAADVIVPAPPILLASSLASL